MKRNPLRTWLPYTFAAIIAPLIAAWPQRAHAADVFWDRGSATNAWGTGGNWSPTDVAAAATGALPGTADVAVFNITALTGAQTIDIGADRTLAGLRFNSTGTVLIQGGGTNRLLTLGTSGMTINAGAGAVTIGSAATNGQGVRISLNGNQTWTNNSSNVATVFNSLIGSGNLNYAGAGGFRITGFTEAGTTDLTSTYTGTTTISSGTRVIAQGNSSFGANSAGTTIDAGGTLDLGGTLANAALNLGTEAFSVSGTGIGGLGAITNTGTAGQQNAIQGAVTMTADTTFGGTQRWDIRNGTLNGGGFNLTKVGANSVFLSGSAQVGTSLNSLIIRQGEFVFETGALASAAKLTDAAAGINVAPTTAVAAAFRSWGNNVNHSASVTLDSTFSGSTARLSVENGVTTHSGSITATGADSRLNTAGDSTRMVIDGVLAGGSAATVAKEGTGTVLFNNAANTHAGILNINAGTVGGSGTLASSTVNWNTGTALSPGNAGAGAGTLTITNALVSSGTNQAVFNLGTSSDLVNAGTLTQNGTTNISVLYGPGLAPGTYSLFDYGTLGGSTGFSGFAFGNHVDGTLVNNTGAGSIDAAIASVTPLRWTGGSNGLWTAGSLTNPVLSNFHWAPDADDKVEFVNFDNVLFDDTNTGTTSIRVISTVTPGSIEFNNSTLDYTVDNLAPTWGTAGNIGGATGIIKNGTGTTTLLGANTFTGPISVNAGTLQFGNDSRVGQLKGGTTGDQPGTGPAISIAAGATLAITSGNSGENIYSNNISGSGAILLNAAEQDFYFNYKADRGNVRFNGDLSGFNGTITINKANRLAVTNPIHLGGTSGLVVQNGGSFYANGAFTASTPLSIAGKGWAETAGMLGAIRLGAGATLSGPITMTGNSRITAFSSTGTLSGVISGAFDLELGLNTTSAGSGNLTLSNPANTYSGDTSLTRINIDADNIANAGVTSSLGRGDDIVMNASALNITGAGPMTSDRTFTLGAMGIGASTIGVTNAANTLTLTGAINNVQPLAASGAAFRQGLNFQQGITAGTGGTVILDTATPIITSGTNVHRQNLTLAGNTNFTVGANGFGTAGTFNVGVSTGTDVGNATLNIQDNAVLSVYGEFDIGNQGAAQTYVVNQSGTSTVNALRGGGAGSDSNILHRGMRIGHWGLQSSTYNLTGGTLNVPNGHLWVGFDGTGTLNQSAATTVNAAGLRMVNINAGAGTYNLNGGTLNVGAYGFAKGGAGASVPQFNFNGGTYRATADHAISGNIAINVNAGGGTIDTNGFNVTSGSALLVGAGGAFTKTGNGELILPTANTVSGGINVNGGALTGAAGATITASTVNVNAGGTLSGGFVISSAGGTVVANRGIVSPGGSAGALGGTLSTSLLTLNAGSQINLAPTNDVITVTTASGLSGNTNINILPVGTLAAGPINLINYTTANTLSFTASLPHLIAASVADNGTGNIVLNHGGQETLTWTGAGGAVWDATTGNTWNASSSGAVNFLQGDVVVFDDSSSVGTIAVASGITPASVAFNNSTTAYTLTGGGITGGTAISKAGTATTILAGDNTNTGTTTITGGTLQIGNGGASGQLGSGATDISAGATLAFNRTGTSKYDGAITGAGSLRSDGPGRTTLNGTNTYSGGTVISQGTLEGNHNSFGTNTITLNDASTGARNTALLIQNGAAVDIVNNIVVSNNGSGTSTIGSSEDSLVGSGLRFTGTLNLNRPTTLLGESDRTTFAGVISGNVGTLTIGRSTGLEDFEMGRVVLEKDNTFTGNVVVQAFTNLQLNDLTNPSANAARNQIPDTASVTLGDTSYLTLADSGTADDPETIGDLSSTFSTSRVRSLSAGSVLTYGTANNATFNGVVEGTNTFDLIKQGSGTQTFGGTLDNTSGRMIVNAGTVVLAKNSSNTVHAIGGALVINTGGTVQLGGTYTAFRDQDTNRDTATQYQPDAPANFVDQIFNNVDVTLNTGGTLDLNGKSEVIDGLIGTGGTVTNTNATASTLYLGAANSADTFSGVIQDGIGVVNIAKGGSGTMVFSGTNTYTGTTSINRDALTITNIAGLGSAAGGTIITGNRENAGSASRLIISVPTASDPSTPNVLAEPLNLSAELSNDLRTEVQNTVESTRLTGAISVSGDGLHQISASQAAGDQFQINGGISGTANGQIFLRGNGELALNSVINLPDIIVSKTDPGTLILNATGHNYREANFVHGTVRTDVVNALDTGAILRMGQGGNGNTVDLNGNNQQIAGLLTNPNVGAQARTITSVAPATLNITNVAAGGDYLYNGNIAGAVTLEKSGAGAQVLGTPGSGTNTYTGNTIINEGTLRLANANLIPDGGTAGNVIVGTGAASAVMDLNGNSETINGLHGNSTGVVTSNGAGSSVLSVNGTATPLTTATFAGVLKDRTDGGTATLALTKTGTGTQVLSGTNTYTGVTNVTNGTLVINGDHSSATGALNVASGATLAGTGTLGSALTVADGGIFAPGNSPGTMTTSNSVTFGATSVMTYEFNGSNMTVGGGINDLFTGITNLTLGGTINVTEIGAGSFLSANLGDMWRIMNYSGTLTGSLATGTMPTLSDPSWSFTVDTSTANQVNLVVVPEASSAGLIGLTALFTLRRRRRAA
jgi:fibronectin-binding autotransporter adhesin